MRQSCDDYERLHRLFVHHLGLAVVFAWGFALFAAGQAPWVRNLSGLLDPMRLGPTESTAAYLFGFPLLLTLSWAICLVAPDLLRKLSLFTDHRIEFLSAAAAAFTLFVMAVHRSLTVLTFSMS